MLEIQEYLKIIKQTGFNDIEVKKRKRVEIPESTLKLVLSEQGLEDYKNNLDGIFSITVVAAKNKL